MKNWLKNIKNEEIIDILKNTTSMRKLYKVPDTIDKRIKLNFKKTSKQIKFK